MKKYFSFFRIYFVGGLQYRAAAWAGIATQFAWGFMNILIFSAFNRSSPSAMPMPFSQLCSYIWLQQAFLALAMPWLFDDEIFDSITSGSVAYELCRPVGIYSMWLARTMAQRVSKAVLRFAPVLIFAALMPEIGLSAPADLSSFLMFCISLVLGLVTVSSFAMLIYASAFYTLSPLGMRILSMSAVEILAGMVVPIPLMPQLAQKLLSVLPFASMQSTPLWIYTGYISGAQALHAMLLQVFWAAVLIWLGAWLVSNGVRKTAIQGG